MSMEYVNNSSFIDDDIDWTKCIICQEDVSKQPLNDPAAGASEKSGDGYKSLSSNIQAFYELKAMPLELKQTIVDLGRSMEDTFQRNQAKWHKSCYLKFNNTKLERKRKALKRRQTDTTSDTVACKRAKRGIAFTFPQNHTCFFCDQKGQI